MQLSIAMITDALYQHMDTVRDKTFWKRYMRYPVLGQTTRIVALGTMEM